MRKQLKRGLALLLILASFCAAAAGEGDVEIEELSLTAEEDFDALWTFPVALEDMNPEYIVLANKHYLLSKDYVPADLVKVPNNPKKGGIKWAGSGTDGKLKGWYLRAECSQALCDMNRRIPDHVSEERVPFLVQAEYHVQKPAEEKQRQG